MLSKLYQWCGEKCIYRIIKENQSYILVLVQHDNKYNLARLIQTSDKVDISVDAEIGNLDFEGISLLLSKCVELLD